MVIKKYENLEAILLEFDDVIYAEKEETTLRVSDGRFLFEVKDESMPSNLPLSKKQKNLKEFISNLPIPFYTQSLSLEQIKKASSNQIEDAFSQCNYCDGDGTLICDHCDSEYECKYCDGIGEDGSESIGKRLKENAFSINGLGIGYRYLSLLWILMEYYNIEKVNFFSSIPMVFQCERFIFIYMPMKLEYYKDKVITEISLSQLQ